MRYDYACPHHGVFEFNDRFASEDQRHACPDCAEPMHRKPCLADAHFHGDGYTKVSTGLSNQARRLSPWFGGPPQNAPDYRDAQDRQHEKQKADTYGAKHAD